MFGMKPKDDSGKNSLNSSNYAQGIPSSAIKQNGQNNPASNSNENGKKSYLMLDEKLFSKTPKSSNTQNTIFSRQLKSTTSADSQTFSFNTTSPTNSNSVSRQNQQANPEQQTSKKSVSKLSEKPQTPSNKREEISPSPVLRSTPQIYYMTWLEKYHKYPDEKDYFSQIYREHYMQSFQAMAFCKFIKPVDPKVLAQKKVFLTKRESHKGESAIKLFFFNSYF